MTNGKLRDILKAIDNWLHSEWLDDTGQDWAEGHREWRQSSYERWSTRAEISFEEPTYGLTPVRLEQDRNIVTLLLDGDHNIVHVMGNLR
jgi:hypothetical protein